MDGVAQVGHVVIGLAVNLHRGLPAAIVARAAIGAVEPHLKLVVAVLCEFGALLQKHVRYVAVGAVVEAVAVPGRDVEAVFHAELTGCGGKVARDVGVATVLVAGFGDVMLGCSRGPEAESVVVLHHGNATPHAGSLHSLQPLQGVGLRSWGKAGLVLVAISPFQVGVSVHSVVEESVELRLLPFHLPLRGYGKDGSRFVVGIVQRLNHYPFVLRQRA